MDAFGLDAAYPDPSVRQAAVGFTLAETTEVRLVVYDVMGREVGPPGERDLPCAHHDLPRLYPDPAPYARAVPVVQRVIGRTPGPLRGKPRLS